MPQSHSPQQGPARGQNDCAGSTPARSGISPLAGEAIQEGDWDEDWFFSPVITGSTDGPQPPTVEKYIQPQETEQDQLSRPDEWLWGSTTVQVWGRPWWQMLSHLKGLGGCLIPCDGNKTPITGKGWQDKDYTADQISALDDPRIQAVGVIAAKTHLVCIDSDAPEAIRFCQRHNLPQPTTWSIGCSNGSKRRQHIDGSTGEQKAQLPKKPGKRSWPDHQLEAFWSSQQLIVAGQHRFGGHYTWHGTAADIAALPDEWFICLQQQPTRQKDIAQQQTFFLSLGDQLIHLQDLLVWDNSRRVYSSFLTSNRSHKLFAFSAGAYSAKTEALRRGATLDATADDLIQLGVSDTNQSDFNDSETQTVLRRARNEHTTITHEFENYWNCVTAKSTVKDVKDNHLLTATQLEAIAELFPYIPTKDGKKISIDAGDLSLLFTDILGDRLTYNELGCLVELDKQPLRKIERTTLLNALRNRCYKLTDLALIEALQSAAYENAYHPVQQYLQGLLNNPSIGDIDLYSLASTFLGADGPLFATMLQRCLVGAVARAMTPGCQMDYVCVLHGAQGIGKSSFWRILFGDWFKVFHAELGNKDSCLALHDAWGIELGKIDAITSKKEVAKLKNFISTRVDYFRLPCERTSERLKCSSVLVGFCNRDDFLNKITGERRYWVIPVSKQLNREKLYQLRDAIWRSAALTWQSGILPYLPVNLELENENHNKRYSKDSILDSHLAQYLEGKTIVSKPKLKEFVNNLNLVITGKIEINIFAAMLRLGWRNHQYKNYPRVWVRDTPEAIQLGYSLVRTLDHSVNTF